MEPVFRYAAIVALCVRLAILAYEKYSGLRATRGSRLMPAIPTATARLGRPDIALFTNLWVAVAMTSWVTTLLSSGDPSAL